MHLSLHTSGSEGVLWQSFHNCSERTRVPQITPSLIWIGLHFANPHPILLGKANEKREEEGLLSFYVGKKLDPLFPHSMVLLYINRSGDKVELSRLGQCHATHPHTPLWEFKNLYVGWTVCIQARKGPSWRLHFLALPPMHKPSSFHPNTRSKVQLKWIEKVLERKLRMNTWTGSAFFHLMNLPKNGNSAFVSQNA